MFSYHYKMSCISYKLLDLLFEALHITSPIILYAFYTLANMSAIFLWSPYLVFYLYPIFVLLWKCLSLLFFILSLTKPWLSFLLSKSSRSAIFTTKHIIRVHIEITWFLNVDKQGLELLFH